MALIGCLYRSVCPGVQDHGDTMGAIPEATSNLTGLGNLVCETSESRCVVRLAGVDGS